jgi:hypothetical protein
MLRIAVPPVTPARPGGNLPMLTILGRTQRVCQGVSRRRLLQAGGAGLLGVDLPAVLAAEALRPVQIARARSIVVLYIYGGPCQLETFDM